MWKKVIRHISNKHHSSAVWACGFPVQPFSVELHTASAEFKDPKGSSSVAQQLTHSTERERQWSIPPQLCSLGWILSPASACLACGTAVCSGKHTYLQQYVNSCLGAVVTNGI